MTGLSGRRRADVSGTDGALGHAIALGKCVLRQLPEPAKQDYLGLDVLPAVNGREHVNAVSFPVLDEDAPDSEGVVAAWFTRDDTLVQTGELLGAVQVSKIAGEVHAPVSGTLRQPIREGEVITRGAVIAHIE